jgi:hypothetical protein
VAFLTGLLGGPDGIFDGLFDAFGKGTGPHCARELKGSCNAQDIGRRWILAFFKILDNERGKGDHRHYGSREEPYVFSTTAQLLDDFERDVVTARGEAI